MAGVILTGVSRVFPGGVVACDALDLEIRDGELLVLVGPSGSGKTTLLRLIAGLERPTSGTITIGGRVVNGVSPSQRNLAMVFQSHALHPHWTAYENIAFGLRLKKPPLGLERVWRKFARSGREPATASGPELRQRVLDAARQLGIDGLLERLPSELSGGEQQRVALARAIVRRPTLFLFDEPFSSLDAQLRVEMRRKLKQLHQQLGTSTIYVTHDQSDALALADRLAVLNRGKVEQVGTPREVYDWPASPFVAGFVGSPSMNLFRGQRVEGATEGAWRLSVEGWSIQVEGPWWRAESALTAVVGLRPEDIHLRPVGQPERGQPERGQPEMGQPEMGQPEGGPPDPSWASCPAARGRVDLIEDLGDTRVVSLTLDHDEQTKNRASPERPGAVLLCKRQDRSGLARGEHVIAWFDMRRAHWFDGLTGRNLRQPGAR